MRPVYFRCPATGLHVDVIVADDEADDGEAFVPLACTACSGLHFVNVRTGKVLGSEPLRKDTD